MKRYALLMIAACLLAIFPIGALAASVGKFTHVEGQVDVLSPGQAARAAKLGDEVSVGETLRTKSQSKAEVTFDDGNTLRLAEKTAMEIKEYMVSQDRSSGILSLSRGKIQNSIKAAAGRIFGQDKKNRFEVHTPTAVVGVRGTNFFSYYLRGVSGAIFQEGTGYGYNVNKPEQVKTIRAGQAMVVAGPDKVPVIKPATDVEIKQHINDTAPSEKPEGKKEDGSPVTGAEPSLFLAEPGYAESDLELESVGTGETFGPSGTIVVDIPPPIPSSLGVDFTASLNLDFMESGTMSGSFSETSGMSNVSVSGTLTEAAPTPHYGDISGTMSDGSAFAGYLGGVVGSWNAVFSSLYAKEGNIGYFYGNLSGIMDSENLTLSASGSVYRTPAYGSLTLEPQEGQTLTDALHYAMSSYLFDPGHLPIISSLDMSTGAVQGSPYSSETLGIQSSSGRVLGIWRALTTEGYFSNPSALSSNSFLYGQYGMYDYYMLGQVSASDNLNGHAAINGTLTYMNLYYMGDVSLWYNGTYGSPYSSAGVGTFTLDPLAYTGYWNYYYPGDCLFSNESGNFQWVGADYGIFGGTTAPWNNDVSPFRAMGNYSYSESVSSEHLLWNTMLIGWAPDDEYNRLVGFTGGIWKDAPGSTYATQYGDLAAIYMASDGRAGLLTSSDLSGYHYPGLSMWITDGNLVRHQMTTVSNPYDYEIYPGYMDGRLVGGYGASSSIWGSSYSGSTLFFKDYIAYESLPWGIYDLKLGSENYFEGKPAGLASWSAVSGGQGTFGYTETGGEQSGYWIAPVTGTWTEDGEIAGNLSGTYLTLSQRGTLGGPLRGVNVVNGAGSGTWIGQSVGTFQGEPLTFSSDFRSDRDGNEIPAYRLVPGTAYEGGFRIRSFSEIGGMEDVASYDYEYFISQSSSRLLYGQKEIDDATSTEDWMDLYLPAGRIFYFYERESPFIPFHRYSEGAWTVGSMVESDFSTPPDSYTGWERDWYKEFPSNALEQSGIVGGILGGSGDLWTASAQSPVQMNLMGYYYPLSEESYAGPSLFGTEVMQSSHTSGGAYSGYLGGVLAEEARGAFYALYIAENGVNGFHPAGVLKGSFSGPVYPSLNMWEASGSIYPIPMTGEMELSPADLQENLDRGFIAAWVDGDFGSQGSFLKGGLAWGSTLSIMGHSDWGVFGLFLGYENYFNNPLLSGAWNARAGGWAEFGTHLSLEGDTHDIGMWISSPLTGSATNGFLTADFSGAFLTYAKYGQLKGDVIGTYDYTTQSWQAMAAGYWHESRPLAFNGLFQGEPARMVESYGGHWDNGDAGSYYDYSYDTGANAGWSHKYEAANSYTAQIEYGPDGTFRKWQDADGTLSYEEGTWAGTLPDILKAASPDPDTTGEYGPSYFLEHRGWLSGVMGGLSDLWSANASAPAQIRFIGEYDRYEGGAPPVFSTPIGSYNPYDGSPTIWNQADNSQNGAYYGYLAGRGLGNNTAEGMILAIGLDKSGNAHLVKGIFGASLYPDLEMWEGTGSMFPMEIVPDTGYDAAQLYPDSLLYLSSDQGPMEATGRFIDSPDGVINWLAYQRDRAYIYDPGQTWRLGVSSLTFGGTYDPGTGSDLNFWFRKWDHRDDPSVGNIGAYVSTADAPGAWSNGLISAKGFEAWVNWNDAVTGIGGADLKGTFDPTNKTWQAVALWAWMDTGTFLNLASNAQGREKLNALNIPCIEVGKDTLTGTGGHAGTMTVNMVDTTFFAYSTGARPRIWASGNVNGSGSAGAMEIGSSVPLQGQTISDLRADFAMRSWDASKWTANINNGSGTVGGHAIGFGGVAAGTHPGNGSFTGTASGAAGLLTPAH